MSWFFSRSLKGIFLIEADNPKKSKILGVFECDDCNEYYDGNLS